MNVKFSPSEGGVIFTRAESYNGAIPKIYKVDFDEGADDKLLFNEAFMPDWQ